MSVKHTDTVKDLIIEDSRALTNNANIIDSINQSIKDCNNFIKPVSEYIKDLNSDDKKINLAASVYFKKKLEDIDNKLFEYSQTLKEFNETLKNNISINTEILAKLTTKTKLLDSDQKFYKNALGIISYNQLKLQEMSNKVNEVQNFQENLDNFRLSTLYHLSETISQVPDDLLTDTSLFQNHELEKTLNELKTYKNFTGLLFLTFCLALILVSLGYSLTIDLLPASTKTELGPVYYLFNFVSIICKPTAILFFALSIVQGASALIKYSQNSNDKIEGSFLETLFISIVLFATPSVFLLTATPNIAKVTETTILSLKMNNGLPLVLIVLLFGIVISGYIYYRINQRIKTGKNKLERLELLGQLSTDNVNISRFHPINITPIDDVLDGMIVYGSLSVVFEASDSNLVYIDSDDPEIIAAIEVYFNNNCLELRMENNINNRKFSRTKIYVKYPKFKFLTFNGSGTFEAFNLDQEDLRLKLNGSGEIYLAGTCAITSIKVSGSGIVDMKKLESEKATLIVAGSGSITSYVRGEVKAHVNGSGDIEIFGNPVNRRAEQRGSGRIEFK